MINDKVRRKMIDLVLPELSGNLYQGMYGFYRNLHERKCDWYEVRRCI